VIPIEALYVTGLARALSYRSAGERLLVLFLGSTIGNFDRPAAGDFLSTIRGYLDAGDALLLGADLADSEPRLLAAYDDAIGVTAAFNLNLLARINRDLRGDFRVRSFAHEVRYDRRERRIEMHLRSRRAQEVHIREAGIAVHFEAGETIWTESSHKFSLEEVRAMAIRSGFDCVEQWVDREWPFADSLLVSRR
jgi:uncharacterized SAM-dependent methyltransferase